MTPWYENDELWAELQAVLLDKSMMQGCAEEARQAAALLKAQPGGHLLDLGCGPGRHTIELARLGYRVTGVDRTTGYLEVAQERAAAADVEVELVHGNMLTFRRDAAFDGAISLLSSFGYFEDRNDDLAVLRNIQASLRGGAKVVIDLMGKEIIARQFRPKYWQELESGRLWLQEPEVLPGWEMMRNHWVFLGGGDRKEFVIEHRMYSGVELADLMREAGFTKVALHGALDGRPYDKDAARLVAVGRK